MASPVSARGRNLALIAALLGWMFDGMEMGLFPLVGKDALTELLEVNERVDAMSAVAGAPAGAALRKDLQSEVDRWYGVIIACFLVGAATGGVLFGWLGDKIGRVRAMTISVLLYSVASGLSAASGAAWQLGLLRFLGALGMGGEWALGVALVMELWPSTSRAWLAGWIGAFGNFGYLICGAILMGLNHTNPGEVSRWLVNVGLPTEWAGALTANGHWRMLMFVGAVPALLTLFIRLFVPESEKWTREKEAGKASHWAERDLLGVLVGAAAALGVIAIWALPKGAIDDWIEVTGYDMSIRLGASAIGLVVVICGYLYPARGYLLRSGLAVSARRATLLRMLLAAGISGVPLLGTWAGLMWMYIWVTNLPGYNADAKPWLQISSSIGAIIGCLVGAVLGGVFGRKPVYAALCILSLLAMIGFYQQGRLYEDGIPPYGTLFVIFAGILGMVSAAFYGWLPLYLPELFPTAVRATGQGFGFNFGRIIAAAGSLQMANLLAAFDNDYAQACAVVAGVYIAGLLLIAIAPETKGKPLPE